MAVATDPVIQQITEKQGIQIGETLDFLSYSQLRAGTQVTFARSSGSTGRVDVNRSIANIDGILNGVGSVSSNLIDTATRVERNDCMKITKMVTPTPDFGTTAIDQAYVAVAHVDLRQDIASLPNFTPVEQYSAFSFEA